MHIYVSNLGERITNASLDAIFSAHGEVASSTVVNEGRGHAFVEMPDRQQGMNAIKKINGAVIDGRTIEAKEAQIGTSEIKSHSVEL